VAQTKGKEYRTLEVPGGTRERLEEARKRHGHRSINALVWSVLGPWLDADEEKSAKAGKGRAR
jgi:hypothetical protein